MNDLFDRNAHRLTDEERERLWRRISAALPTPGVGDPEQRQSRRSLRRLRWTPALTGAAVTAAAVLALLIYVRLPQSPRDAIRAAERQLLPQQPAAPEAVPMPKAEGKAEQGLHAAAPAPPIGDLAVAPPAPAGREPAAAAEATTAPSQGTLHRTEVPELDVASAPDKGVAEGGASSPIGQSSLRDVSVSASVAEDGAVRGRVGDLQSGQPLPYATIVLVAADGDSTNRVVAVSLGDGTFTARALVPGHRYTLEARHLGFDPQRVDVDLTRRDPVEVAFELQPIIVAVLDDLGAGAAQHRIDGKGAKQEHSIGSERAPERRRGSVGDAVRGQAGTAERAAETHVRSGREAEVEFKVDQAITLEGPPATPPPSASAPTVAERQSAPSTGLRDVRPTPPGVRPTPPADWDEPPVPRPVRPVPWRPGCVWVPPHWSHPNNEPFDAMYFQHYGVNPFIVTEEDNQSTFALDVDNASYTITRRYLREGHLPPRDAVRVEEFVNALPQGYTPLRQDDFRIQVDGAPSPFGEGYHLLRVGLQAREVSDSRRPTAHLVFVVDVSGSMSRDNRLEAVKRALLMLLDELRGDDTVGIVAFETSGHIVLEPTSIEMRHRIERAIESLRPMGSTNLDEGLTLGYRMARSIRDRGAIKRIILCSDGVANQARTSAEEILEHARRGRDDGIHLSSVGFGMGNYNDVLMEKLADQGDGNYYYVDRYDEAARVFRENLTGLLQTIAEDAKVQVEFDPRAVLRYRLLGYENRDVADRDFRNDRVDAGEVGAGHQVTALYEIKLAPRPEGLLGVVRLRYRVPAHAGREAGRVRELEKRIVASDLAPRFSRADPHLQLAAVAAELAEILRASYWAKGSRVADLRPFVDQLDRELVCEPAVAEFLQMVNQAERLERRRPQPPDDHWPED